MQTIDADFLKQLLLELPGERHCQGVLDLAVTRLVERPAVGLARIWTNVLCIGVEDPEGKNLKANPGNDYTLNKTDLLIVISQDRPTIA